MAKGLGVASIETRVPVTADTLFRLGSTTKMFTAAALLQLALDGKVDPGQRMHLGFALAIALPDRVEADEGRARGHGVSSAAARR